MDHGSLVVGAGVRLDSSFHMAGNIHFAEGFHRGGPKPCAIIATENSKEFIEGDMDISANVTLHLKPTLVGNWSSGWHLRFVPTVRVAGVLTSFHAKVFSQTALPFRPVVWPRHLHRPCRRSSRMSQSSASRC